MKEKSKSQKQITKRKCSLSLLLYILVHRSTRSLLAGDTLNVCQDIDLRVDPGPFFISFQISTINKNTRSNTPMNPKTYFKWVFMYIILATYSKSLTKGNTFSNFLLILFQNSKTLWNEKYYYWGSHGQARYVSVNIWKSRWICLVGYVDNSNWL